MDLQKIGLYIAQKRKKLGLTQRQLADILSMSDKSVSKWERGICLPDASIYLQLCEALGISLNEFLAGEDIENTELGRKSESNLLQLLRVNKKEKIKQKKLIFSFVLMIILSVVMAGTYIYKEGFFQNYIELASKDSIENKAIQLMSTPDEAFLFDFKSREKFKTLKVFMREYRNGKFKSKEKVAELGYDNMASTKEGKILIVPLAKEGKVKLIIADEVGKYSTALPILENVNNRQYLGKTASETSGREKLIYGKEQPLLGLIFGENEVQALSLDDLKQGHVDNFKDGYVYYFSVLFTR